MVFLTSKSDIFNTKENNKYLLNFTSWRLWLTLGLEYFNKILQHLNIISTLRQCLSPRQTSFKISRSSFENFKLNSALRKKRLDRSLEKIIQILNYFYFKHVKLVKCFIQQAQNRRAQSNRD